MKIFRYNQSTLTVGELRAILDNHPPDMPVLATWEGIYTCFRPANYLNPHNGETEDFVTVDTPDELKEPCLVFDVDQY